MSKVLQIKLLVTCRDNESGKQALHKSPIWLMYVYSAPRLDSSFWSKNRASAEGKTAPLCLAYHLCCIPFLMAQLSLDILHSTNDKPIAYADGIAKH